METEHFFIEDCHWNEGTRMPRYNIAAKANTKESNAMVFNTPSGNDPEYLQAMLERTEGIYMANKILLERNS